MMRFVKAGQNLVAKYPEKCEKYSLAKFADFEY